MKNIFKTKLGIIFILLIISFQIISSVINPKFLNAVSSNNTSISIKNPLIKLDNQSKNLKNKGKYIIKLKDNLTLNEKNTYLKSNKLEEVTLEGNKVSTNRILTNNIDNKIDLRYVDKVEEDGTLETQQVKINDPNFKDQWYLKAIDYNKMVENPNKEKKIVAVIDSGICNNNVELNNKIITGWNFVDNNIDTNDSIGHGCLIAGIIAANTNNNTGIAGSSLNTQIMPLKVIGSDGVGDYSALINAIDYATIKKVNIINISLGGFFDSTLLHDVILKAINSGITVIASAGNTSNSDIMYPANYEEVVSVGSVENDYTVSSFSSNNDKIQVWAYGSNILSINKDNTYTTSSGTSLAAALVTGFVAEGGQYVKGSIISYDSKDQKPIFNNIQKDVNESSTSLSFTIPQGLKTYEFANSDMKDTFINWERNIQVSKTESLIVSVWNRSSDKAINDLIQFYKKAENCSFDDNTCIFNNPHPAGEYTTFSMYIKKDTNLIKLTYNINDFLGYRLFKEILSSVKINNISIDYLKDIKFLENHVKIPQTITTQGTATCGGFNDPGNDFPCCSEDIDHNSANCTWYAEFKRPDLRHKISGNAGNWYQSAKDNHIPVSPDTPVPGSIAVWSGHVAYVESVDYVNKKMTWSEQNCYKYWTDQNGGIHYGVNAYNASVTRAYPNTYGGTFEGYILPTTLDCNGTNVTLSNWNPNGPLTCNPISSIIIKPTSAIQANSSNILIIPH